MDSADKTTTGLPGLSLLRKSRGLTQEQLADMANLHRVTLSDYERGKQDPRQAIVRKLAGILDCQPGDLVNTPAEVGSDTA